VLTHALQDILHRLENAAQAAGRPIPRLLAVSKTQPADAVSALADLGQRAFGENYVQEAAAKQDALARLGLEWHLIGHLQSNKAKKAAAAVHFIHAIDSVDLLRRVDQAAAAEGRSVEVLVQVDLALEATKHGAAVDEVPVIFAAANDCGSANLIGLRVLPPLTEKPEEARPWFARLRGMRDRLRGEGVAETRLRELSMGMSHDFEVAIEEGATMVRVGTAIFGERARNYE
jgi:PLP dependent protein